MICVAVVFFFIGKKCSNSGFESLEKYEMENEVLRRQCDSLQAYVTFLQRESSVFFYAIDSLNAVINLSKKQIIENQKKYEKEIADIYSIPTDSVFSIFKEYTR